VSPSLTLVGWPGSEAVEFRLLALTLGAGEGGGTTHPAEISC
jgi:hypothetical protein